MTFTTQVREELAHLPAGDPCCRRSETSAALRLGASFQRRGGAGKGFGLVLRTTSGAVARRLHTSLRSLAGVRPEVAVVEAGGLRRETVYRLTVTAEAAPGLADLGVLGAEGRPVPAIPHPVVARPCDWVAYVRGALLVAGSVSDPRRSPHLEVAVAGEGVAEGLARMLRSCGAGGAKSSPHRDGWRVVVKSGDEIAGVLARTGAHTAFLAFDQGRLRRELRGAANRAANADRANLGRSVGASGRQVDAIERAVAAVGWDGLPDPLRAVALARLANPEASLAELGDLVDPPLGKAAVHRRLRRLLDLADGVTDGEP